jgi:hypothetical protein
MAAIGLVHHAKAITSSVIALLIEAIHVETTMIWEEIR